MACPVSTITRRTWEIIRLIGRCTGGDNSDLQHLPFPGTLLDQPGWFLDAVDLMRSERAKYRKQQMDKKRT